MLESTYARDTCGDSDQDGSSVIMFACWLIETEIQRILKAHLCERDMNLPMHCSMIPICYGKKL